MPISDLKGKTVMIAEGNPNQSLLPSLKQELTEQGATVVVSQHSPRDPKNVSLISEEIANHQPKIDALIVHDLDTSLPSSQIAAVALAKKFKDTLPVVVHDWNDDMRVTQSIENAGAKYLDFDAPNGKVTFAVADAIAQHGKPGRSVGGT